MKIKYWPEEYCVAKLKQLVDCTNFEGFFSFTVTDSENSLVAEKGVVDAIDNDLVVKKESGFKLITFDAKMDFNLIGFISKISNALASENISIFVVFTYDTDHLLVKKKDINKTKEVLNKLSIIHNS